MIDKQALAANLMRGLAYLTAAMTHVRDADFDRKPSPLAWSPADVVEHLVILEALVVQILQGRTKPLAEGGCDRGSDPGYKIEEIKTTFLDRENKLIAGAPVTPQGMYKEKDILISKLKRNRQTLVEIIGTVDLTAICIDFKHQLFGELTRLEWMYFVIYHSERHMRQISTEAARFLDSLKSS